jgi:hypothetical protein
MSNGRHYLPLQQLLQLDLQNEDLPSAYCIPGGISLVCASSRATVASTRGSPPPSLPVPLLPLRRGGAATMAGAGCCGLELIEEARSSRCGSRRRGGARWRGAPVVDLGGAELTTSSHGRAGIWSRQLGGWEPRKRPTKAGSSASGRRRTGFGDGRARAARSTPPRHWWTSPTSRSTPLLRSSPAPRELHGRQKAQHLADAEQLAGPSSTAGEIQGNDGAYAAPKPGPLPSTLMPPRAPLPRRSVYLPAERRRRLQATVGPPDAASVPIFASLLHLRSPPAQSQLPREHNYPESLCEGWGMLLDTLLFCSTRFFSSVLHIGPFCRCVAGVCWR